jgi:hypothetical protein
MNKATRSAAIMGVLMLLALKNSIAQVQTYCSNIGGNIACTSYDQGASSQTYCSSIGGNLSCTTYGNETTRVQMQRDYAAGQVIGTAVGYAILAAIDEYKAHKRLQEAKKDDWNQFVQDTLSTVQLSCETDPSHEMPPTACRTAIHLFNQFIQLHQKDFVPDGRNVKLLASALANTPNDESAWTEQTFETAFQTLDKKQLDKKPYFGFDGKRGVW